MEFGTNPVGMAIIRHSAFTDTVQTLMIRIDEQVDVLVKNPFDPDSEYSEDQARAYAIMSAAEKEIDDLLESYVEAGITATA